MLRCQSASNAGLIALGKNPSLVRLELSTAADIGESELVALAALPALQKIQLGGLSCACWPAGFPTLTELTLLSSKLAAEGAAGLSQLPQLAELGIFGVQFAEGALGNLARLRALRHLKLFCGDVSNTKLLELAGSSLQLLHVHEAWLFNDALAVIEHLPEFIDLRLERLAVDDQGMRRLPGAARLRDLRLTDVPISDAGLTELARCPALRTQRLSGTRVTAAGIAAIRQAAPAIDVVEV